MIVTAPEGMEADAIQAFRLGARDYLVKPLREAEVVASVERALMEIRLRKEHDHLTEQLAESNRQLERRVRELTTLFGLGKTVTSTTNQPQLFSKLMEGSLYITDADLGWVLLKRESDDQLVLRAERHLPPTMAAKMHQVWDDGVSSLVLLSGEALILHGEGLRTSRIAELGKSALLVPITVRDQPIGVICVARETREAFTERHKLMLEAVADYASISLVNARLFQALEKRAQQLEQEIARAEAASQVEQDWWQEANRTVRAAMTEIGNLQKELKGGTGEKELKTIQDDLNSLLGQLSDIAPPDAD
jgi:two-component system NtrC family sensor kinase